MTWIFRIIAPIGHFLRFIPLVKVFTQAQPEESLIGAGFKIDHAWLPKKNAATCIVAIKQN